MIIREENGFFFGSQESTTLTEAQRKKLLALANEETAEELADLIAEAEAVAEPLALFTVSPVTEVGEASVKIGDITVESAWVAGKLGGKARCFPYIVTCGKALEDWSSQYDGDPLAEFWADEIKKIYLGRTSKEFFDYLKANYRTGGHLTALNPGSLEGWPIQGQRELFRMLGGRDWVGERAGVRYTDSYLMIPSKTVSGVAFESEVFYENCQYCPLEKCPNRRARRIESHD